MYGAVLFGRRVKNFFHGPVVIRAVRDGICGRTAQERVFERPVSPVRFFVPLVSVDFVLLFFFFFATPSPGVIKTYKNTKSGRRRKPQAKHTRVYVFFFANARSVTPRVEGLHSTVNENRDFIVVGYLANTT